MLETTSHLMLPFNKAKYHRGPSPLRKTEIRIAPTKSSASTLRSLSAPSVKSLSDAEILWVVQWCRRCPSSCRHAMVKQSSTKVRIIWCLAWRCRTGKTSKICKIKRFLLLVCTRIPRGVQVITSIDVLRQSLEEKDWKKFKNFIQMLNLAVKTQSVISRWSEFLYQNEF